MNRAVYGGCVARYVGRVGTWGDGIYDNDGALDRLTELVRVDAEQHDAAGLVAQIGLLAWLRPDALTHAAGDLQATLAALASSLAGLPEATRAALQSLLADPEAATTTGSRGAEVEAVSGGYSDGPKIDALLRFPGAAPAIEALGERAARCLDRALAGKGDLYELASDMAALPVIVELGQAGLWSPTLARVATWRAGFDASDRATKSERGFWRKYVRRVRRGFELLAPGQVAPAKPVAAPRRQPVLLPEFTRFLHPKFGAATLISRTGAGHFEQLELRFDSGETLKVLARFVVPIGK